MDRIEKQEPSRKGVKRIAKAIVWLAVIVVAGALVLSTQGEKLKDSPAVKLTVTTELNESSDLPSVTNVTIEQTTVPFFYRKADTPPKFPEINIETKIGALKNPPVGYRAGAFRPVEGTYNLTIVFREGSEPKTGDLLIMAIRLSDFRGAIIKKTTAFYEWK